MGLWEVVVLWGKLRFCIKVHGSNTIEDVKNNIFERTGVEPTRQKFENIPCSISEEDPDQGVCLRDLNILHDFVLIMTEVPAKKLPGASGMDGFSPVLQQSTKAVWWEARNHRPRTGMYLLILDIDGTIYDAEAKGTENEAFAARPFLHYFLEEVYQKYDILIWSATGIRTMYKKLKFLGMLTNENYKILGCLGKSCMKHVPGNKQTKPLTTVWEIYSNFNAENTLICDDQRTNFIRNKENGVPVLSYRYKNEATDNELLLLARYLQYASTFDDVSQLEHHNWKQCIDTVC